MTKLSCRVNIARHLQDKAGAGAAIWQQCWCTQHHRGVLTRWGIPQRPPEVMLAGCLKLLQGGTAAVVATAVAVFVLMGFCRILWRWFGLGQAGAHCCSEPVG